jgi:hypothetical protein
MSTCALGSLKYWSCERLFFYSVEDSFCMEERYYEGIRLYRLCGDYGLDD